MLKNKLVLGVIGLALVIFLPGCYLPMIANSEVSPALFLVSRGALTSLAMLTALVVLRRPIRLPHASTRVIAWPFCIAAVVLFWAVKWCGPATALSIIALAPVLTYLLPAKNSPRATSRMWLWMLTLVAGVVGFVLTYRHGVWPRFAEGAVISMVATGLNAWYYRGMSVRSTFPKDEQDDELTLFLWIGVWVTVAGLLLSFLPEQGAWARLAHPDELGKLVLFGLLAGTLYLWGNLKAFDPEGLQEIWASPLAQLELVAVLGGESWLLGKQPQPLGWVAMVVILLGIFGLGFEKRRQVAPEIGAT